MNNNTPAMPPDLQAVWGNDPTAHHLIQRWGAHNFRHSALHQLATLETQRQHQLNTLRTTYLKKKTP